MTELDTLDGHLRQLSRDVARIQKPVDRAHAAVTVAKSVLALPRRLSLAMKRLASKATRLRYTALFLMPFPVIGSLAGRIARVLRSVKRTADRARRSADKLQRRIRPAKTAVSRIAPPLAKAKRALDRAQGLLQGWLALNAELRRRHGRRPPEDVEAACAGMNAALAPELDTIAKRLPALAASLTTLSEGLEGVAKAGRPVEQALAAADDLEQRLRPIEGPLRQLDRALKPVKWALDAVSWVTRKVIDPIVNEILKAVGLAKLVNRLERSLNPLARTVAPLERAVGTMERSVAKLGASTRVAAGLDRIPEIETRIVAAMRPLRRLLG